MTRSCGTCREAVFERTPTGRIKTRTPGRCEYPIPIPVLPECVRDIGRRNHPFPKNAIWPNDGQECPLHVARPKK